MLTENAERQYSNGLFLPDSRSNRALCLRTVVFHEKNFPAKQSQTRTHARLSRPHGDARRTPGVEGSPSQGPGAPDFLISHALPHPDRFARQSRLLTASDYQRVFQKQLRSTDGLFTVLARENHGERARLGLAIAKRTLSRATGRNRIKRLARESFRRHQQLLAGLDLVVLGRKGVGEFSNREIAKSLQAHWTNLARRCKNSSSS